MHAFIDRITSSKFARAYSWPLCLIAVTGCCVTPTPPTFAVKFADVEILMTQAEVTALLGPPAAKRSDNLPDGPFMGPQEGLIGVIQPGQPFEEWNYIAAGEVFLIFFAGDEPDVPPNQWNVVGKIQFPQGAAF